MTCSLTLWRFFVGRDDDDDGASRRLDLAEVNLSVSSYCAVVPSARGDGSRVTASAASSPHADESFAAQEGHSLHLRSSPRVSSEGRTFCMYV